MPELELTIQKMIYKTRVSDMKTTTVRQVENMPDLELTIQKIIYKPCVTDMKTPTLGQGETHARFGGNYTENHLRDMCE
jgi:hypothetical protein